MDVSVLASHDARTGIQRIVRGVINALRRNHSFGSMHLVYATRKHGYRIANWNIHLDRITTSSNDTIMTPAAGDVFFGLDLAAHLLPRHFSLLSRYRSEGMKIVSLAYDLLPEQHPNWFNDKTVRNYRRWLRASTKLADGFITISHSVKRDLQEWISNQGIQTASIPVSAIHLAGAIDQSAPSQGLPADSSLLLEKLARTPSVLMVGTIEPRKGYNEALAAFDDLWDRGHEVNLIIVGKPGWKTDGIQDRLRSHPLLDRRLFWFDDASDQWLALLYEVAHLVMAASKAEGLGLPIAEAMAAGKPVLARGIPVFREIGGSQIDYFESDSPDSLGTRILSMLAATDRSHEARVFSWDEAVAQLDQFLWQICTTGTPSSDVCPARNPF
ncbi:glycosyltransferase family 1 protein [Azoarcus sp. KH32C]|uniref:glycosyltransferase family 4 protein n=1 Tax=Azoarcus sp. KH32C TaxID=748247 RepID=UPI00155ABFDD|nr:glycosyltransferase family 1 protein [Azoarcus sp. KH32C]